MAVQFTSDEGLSNSCVRQIYEDSRRNVWVCTRNGLNRFDGAKMNVYHFEEGNERSLGHDIVTFILEMDRDNVIVGNDVGLQSYSYARNNFTNIPLIEYNGDTTHTHIVSLTKFSNGEVHACATADCSFVIKKNQKGELYGEYTNKFCYEGSRPIQLLNTKDDEVWSVTHNHQVVLFSSKRKSLIEGAQGVNKLCVGVNGDIYAGTDHNGLYKYDKSQKQFVRINSAGLDGNVVIKSIKSDGRGTVMVCTDGDGLKLYDEHSGVVTQSITRSTDFNLEKSNIEDAMVDSDGNLWIGVYWKGVVVLPRLSSTFEYVGRRSPGKNTIGTNCVISVLPSKNGGVWVATDNSGLYRISDDGTKSEHWDPAKCGVPVSIASMLEDGKGNLWLGSSIGGIVCMNVASGTFTDYSKLNAEWSKVQRIFDISEDSNHCLWFGSMGNGVFRYNDETKELTNFTDQSMKDKYAVLHNPWVSCVVPKGNKVYVGSADGLDVLEVRKDGLLDNIYQGLKYTSIFDIRVAKDGNAWLATSRGVYCLSTDGKMKNYSVLDGLPNNHVGSVELVEKAGLLTVWVGTDNGLCRIDPTKGTINSFFIGDGLQGNEFCNSVSSERNGTLYFGGINGLNYFDPSNIDNNYASRMLDFRIVDFYLFGVPVYAGQKSGSYDILTESVCDAEEVNLCHSDNTFSIELSSMNLIATHTAYEYSINNGEWISVGEGQNRISFTNMSPGSYFIRIRAVGYSQQSELKSIKVIVHPAWYDSPLAYIIYIILILAIGYVIYMQVKERVAARKVLVTHRQEEELNEARIQFFMNISHEIRTPMTLILAPLEKLKAMDQDAEHQRNYKLIYQNAHRILRLINQLMDVRKIEKGQFKLDYQKVDVVDFLQNLFDVYETTAKNRGIDFQFVHDGMEVLEAMVDPSSFDKIIMNLLSNAFKFTPDGGKIVLELSLETEDTFKVCVTDSGVGIRDEEKQKVFKRFYSAKHQNGYIGTGIGLNLTALLVDLHKGFIKVVDNPKGQGSRFVVSIPLEAKGDQIAGGELSDNAVMKAEQDTLLSHEDLQDTALPIDKIAVKHRNLLVVEDDTAIRKYIHSELSSDFVIHECSNGKEGWEYVQKNPEKVDLIISDIMMPVMEGTSLCQHVKSNFNTNHIPVILMSAKTTEADRIAGMSIGADAYVTKPFNVELLRSTAINILKQRQLLRGKFATAIQQDEKIGQIELTSPDEHLMERVMKVISGNLENPELSVEFVADKVGVSRVHFHRKLKELTGQTPRDFIRSIRLKEAARLLSEKHLDITDVSVATGFKSLSTFSTSFKQVYGMTPSEYMKEKNK